MKSFTNCLFCILFFSLHAVSQQNTEVYLIDISKKNDTIVFGTPLNISNNEGYDNQPSFYDDNSILFSSTRNGQTDVKKYEIKSRETTWLTNTPEGSEYSPLRIPESNALSAVRLDKDGLQRLYKYNIKGGSSQVILSKEKVGYHVWHAPDTLVATILVENQMDLIVHYMADTLTQSVQKNVGRSLQKIPHTDLVSYVSKGNKEGQLTSLNPEIGVTEAIVSTRKIEDFCWLPNGIVIAGEGKNLLKFNPKKDTDWSVLHTFTDSNISNISRIAVNPNGKYLALVSNEPPSKIAQKQVEAYNAGNLDAFVNCYAKDVFVGEFPNNTWYIGHDKMRENYSGLSPENKVYNVEVVNRITMGNKVIDHEKVMKNGEFQQMQVAIYEVESDIITSMHFIFDKTVPNPETIVQKQLDAYNERDIEGFLDTYTDAIPLYNFPDKERSQGKTKMRENYTRFFQSATDLHCELKNRIVIGNKVIDQEWITANGRNFGAVAIYEVQNGKIAKVTFIR